MNILVASDSPQTTATLRALLSADPDVQVVGLAQSGKQAIELTRQLHPDLVALDACLPTNVGIETIADIVGNTQSLVTIVAPHACADTDRAARFLEAGATDIAELPDELAQPMAVSLSPERLRELGRDILQKLKAAVDNRKMDLGSEIDPASKRILVVEDSSIDMWVIENTLAQAGYQVLTANNGAGAIGIVGETPPDLVILDYMLPDMDGIQVLRQIRSMAPDTYVIITTGHGSERVAAAALHEHANYYLIKPIIPWQLLKLIHSSIQQRETSRALAHLTRLHLNVLDQLPVGVFVLDKDLRIQAWNQAIQTLTQQPATEVLGQPFSDQCPCATALGGASALRSLPTNATQTIDEIEFIDVDGEKRLISLQLCRMAGDGQIIGVVQDVTAQVALREQLLQAERATTISRMVVTTSHEINNPLTVILSNVLFLEEELAPLPDVAERDLDLIKQSIAQIQRVIERMQQLVEPTATWYMPGVEMYDIHEQEGELEGKEP